MNALYVATVSGEAGFAVGVGLTMATTWLRQRTQTTTGRRSVDPAPGAGWDDTAREAVAGEFAEHSAGVGRQLAAFADELADGDPVLRERLRHIERQLIRGV